MLLLTTVRGTGDRLSLRSCKSYKIGTGSRTSPTRHDVVGTMVIGALLVVVAVAIGADTQSRLIGESAAPPVRRAVRNF